MSNGRKNKRRMSASKRIFIKSFAITLLSSGIIILFGVTAWNLAVSPPAQAEVIPGPRPSDNSDVDEEGFVIPSNPRPPSSIVQNDHVANDDHDRRPSNAPYWAIDRREYFWTFLIVGLNEGTNANTVMVASYCGITREANLVAIPRDVPVNPTRNGRRISSSYIIGHRHRGGIAGGVRQMQDDVFTVIGFIPDFYVVIDYDAFFTIIDAVGGIYIDVPIRMVYNDRWQNLHIDLMPGLQHMNSQTALEFSRFRQGDPGFPDLPGGDLGRIQSQQQVISAVITQLLRVENLTPTRISQFVDIFNESVHTDISLSDMLYFANELRHVSGLDALNTHTFPTHGGTVGGVSYQFLTPATVVELINRTINPFDRDISVTDLRIVGR